MVSTLFHTLSRAQLQLDTFATFALSNDASLDFLCFPSLFP